MPERVQEGTNYQQGYSNICATY